MTHLYTLLVGGTVITGRDEPDASAIAWAADTVITIGTDEEVRGTSRGDSRVIDLGGAIVLPLDETGVRWPPEATLEVGGRADLVLLELDPRRAVVPAGRRLSTIALVRGGVVVAGQLPGAEAEPGHDHQPISQDGRP